MYSFDQVKAAYIKLKSYIYYDNTDILLRRQLAEFETNRTKDNTAYFGGGPAHLYQLKKRSLSLTEIIENKLVKITHEINNFHEDPQFFDHWISKIGVSLYPKKFQEREEEKNFITNKRVESNYIVERDTAFIKAPIEIHILSVLWILERGKSMDAALSENCYGNRLLLNKEKEAVVQGSGLFKPYFNQYQKWRDESVATAKDLLGKGNDVLFLNLDIRDYFHSVRIKGSSLFNGRKHKNLQEYYNLDEIFLKIHQHYTDTVAAKFKTPYAFGSDLTVDDDLNYQEVILPIGLLSSYILANDYLKDFDKRISDKIKPAYYGRYVDDILIVITNPNPDYNKEESLEELKFSFTKYKRQHKKADGTISFKEKDITLLEMFVLENFYPIIKLVDTPAFFLKKTTEPKINKSFKLSGYERLYCQSDKTLLYYFDCEESDLVIDKLKKELDARTSEFRDFPTEKENQETFEESAYHLLYDGTEGKIRTLKDYKENRFGLTIYLANKIFSALRHDKKISKNEISQVLKFFKGLNCISFYRLWERIFTYFLVNDEAEAYVKFYLHCAEQIEKTKARVGTPATSKNNMHETLVEYLDCAHELAISLDPAFISKTKKAAINFEFQLNKLSANNYAFFALSFEPTKSDSFWVRRFRETNMIRHSYVVHPLLNYTTEAKKGWMQLTKLHIDFSKYKLDEELVNNSPRPIKYWECCLSTAYENIADCKQAFPDPVRQPAGTNLFGIGEFEEDETERSEEKFYLNDAFLLYKKINSNHIPEYKFDDDLFRDSFYKRKSANLSYDEVKPVWVQEIKVNSSSSNGLNQPVIAFANTEVYANNIEASIRDVPNLGLNRYQKLSEILEKARREKSDMLLFPECFTNINLLSSLVRYSAKNDVMVVTGLEHIQNAGFAFNFIVTVLPVQVGGIMDAVVIFRLKNHYSHGEELLVKKNHLNVPKPMPYRYDLFNWKNIYFSSYYCFELANALHRSMFKSKLDILIGVEWNRDTPYFSNIVEAGSRDLHVYVAQVNTSQFGDTRLTQPVETARKDILRLKGGRNDAILTAQINISSLREFQRNQYDPLDQTFKPLPPDFSLEDVLKRINNQSVL
ncbi:hypothetical protein ABIC45_002961 [Mucilaginibacter rubeus]|uniref:hypothetical protein n=1 Tax=Mucilaginibacter rubeus TaxID=2027860 RepID=UPI0033966667